MQYLLHGRAAASQAEIAAHAADDGLYHGHALASYVLLVGYVSRDVKRRNMSAALWMLIVVVMPGGIGAVVYFLLRQPIMIPLPALQHGTDREGAFLSAVPVPGGAGVRPVLPRRADHGCVLPAMRTRRRRGPAPAQAARV